MAAPKGDGAPFRPDENKLAALGMTANDLLNIFVVEATDLLVEPMQSAMRKSLEIDFQPDPADGMPGVVSPFPDELEGERTEPTERENHSIHIVPAWDSSSGTFDSSCSRSISEMEEFRRKLQDDLRLGSMYQLRHNFSERFDNFAFLHPHGTTNFDYKAIKPKRKPGFENFKNRVRQENYIYLGNHPEVRAMISMFMKKLLHAQPHDPATYMAEFFTSRLQDSEFKSQLEAEMKRISRYRVQKMQAQGRVKLRPVPHAVPVDLEEGATIPLETDVNVTKKLNIGPLAQDFYFDANFLPKKKEVKVEEKPKSKKKKKHVYCGCKDFKVKGREKCAKDDGTSDGETHHKVSDSKRVHPKTNSEADEMADEIVNAMIRPDYGVSKSKSTISLAATPSRKKKYTFL